MKQAKKYSIDETFKTDGSSSLGRFDFRAKVLILFIDRKKTECVIEC